MEITLQLLVPKCSKWILLDWRETPESLLSDWRWLRSYQVIAVWARGAKNGRTLTDDFILRWMRDYPPPSKNTQIKTLTHFTTDRWRFSSRQTSLHLFILSPSLKWFNTILFDLHGKSSCWLHHISFPLPLRLRVKLDSRTFVAMADSAACKTFRVK